MNEKDAKSEVFRKWRAIPKGVRLVAGLILFVGVVAFSQPGFAGGLFEDVGKSIGKAVQDSGRVIEKAAQDTGATINQAVKPVPPISTAAPAATLKEQPEKKVEIQTFYKHLLTIPDDDLALLSEMENPCTDVDCQNLLPATAARIVKLTYDRRQAHGDAVTKQQQAWAATGSCFFSLFSLIVSFASFARAGRNTRAAAQSA
jgi:hypothetical protein